jgi:hypothetical protein
MRRLPATLAGIALAVTLATPAWAATTEHRHHRYHGQSAGPAQRGRDGDAAQHDDPSILF